MRERVEKFHKDFEKAVVNLEDAIASIVDDLDIDGAIKRFELCYELSWKLIKEYLADAGIICRNPRDCFKSAFQNDLIDEQERWLDMIDDRNYLVHVYTFEDSRKIFDNIKKSYAASFRYLYDKIKEKSADEQK